MKNTCLVLLILFSFQWLQSQSLIGIWEISIPINTEVVKGDVNIVYIFTKNHMAASGFESKTGAFIGTYGGTWTMDGDTIKQFIEFDSTDPKRIGTTVSTKIKLENDELQIEDLEHTLKRSDNGTSGALAGAWLMSGRKRDGEFQSRDTTRPRKTMKILSGTRFQWIAYNTETKQFMGTGGGTYTTIDGKYTENIEFFSKDNSRVGASLEFDFELKNGDWHHSGLSSKKQPIYEVWSHRK